MIEVVPDEKWCPLWTPTGRLPPSRVVGAGGFGEPGQPDQRGEAVLGPRQMRSDRVQPRAANDGAQDGGDDRKTV
jgi:hypothetical protein